MTTLSEVFERTRSEGRAALIGYLPAGFPTVERSIEIIEAMVAGGVDIVEVGLPYSDPLMDGPLIQRAAAMALQSGTTPSDVLRVVEAVARTGAATLVMSYWNPIEQYGVERFAEELAAAGGVGVITPDLTPEEADPWIAATDAHRIDRVFLVAPSSTDERIAVVARVSGGFVYAASMMGVTGVRAELSATAGDLVARMRQHTSLPICMGIGVTTPAQAAEVAGFADGVIVGSAFVKAVLEAGEDAPAAAGSLARLLAEGVRTV